METLTIHNDTIYREMLAEIERLFDATPGTSEGDWLEVLVTRIEAYERKHFPILPPNPECSEEGA